MSVAPYVGQQPQEFELQDCGFEPANFDDLREAVNTLEEIEPTARRVLGSAHPLAKIIGNNLRLARAALQAATEK